MTRDLQVQAPSAGDIRRLCGGIADWKIAAIEQSGASLGDIEAALAWADGGPPQVRRSSAWITPCGWPVR